MVDWKTAKRGDIEKQGPYMAMYLKIKRMTYDFNGFGKFQSSADNRRSSGYHLFSYTHHIRVLIISEYILPSLQKNLLILLQTIINKWTGTHKTPRIIYKLNFKVLFISEVVHSILWNNLYILYEFFHIIQRCTHYPLEKPIHIISESF